MANTNQVSSGSNGTSRAMHSTGKGGLSSSSSAKKGADDDEENQIDHLNLAKETLTEHLAGIAEKIKALTPKSGSVGKAGHLVSKGLTSVTEYLNAHTASDLSGDVVALVKKYPFRISATLGGAGLGFFLARRYEMRLNSRRGMPAVELKQTGSALQRKEGRVDDKKSPSTKQRT